MSKSEDIHRGDFVIRVRPTENDGEWTGEIDISIISQGDNPLDDESYGQVMHFCKMMCATVPIMEQDETIRNLIHTYVMEVVDNDVGIDVETLVTFVMFIIRFVNYPIKVILIQVWLPETLIV